MSKCRDLHVFVALAVLCVGECGYAQRSETFIKRNDRDGDGKLSREEFPARFRRLFRRIDANKDGFVTVEEDAAFRRFRSQGGNRRNRMNAPNVPPPDFANVSYGPHERNVLDFWKAKAKSPTPVLVFFHGGGFRDGDKRGV
ncbi:MAG TPA: hypothetical protein EYP14_12270, partial [Planctomycetaceae bacterium]|nr:hypothetical protein [Planctomycetaceae bacterium]